MIKFKWCGHIHEGVIISQEPHPLQGQKTVIKITSLSNCTYTLYGKVELGNCGPFTVLSLT